MHDIVRKNLNLNIPCNLLGFEIETVGIKGFSKENLILVSIGWNLEKGL